MTTATPTAGDTTTFAELGLEPDLVAALTEQGITTPFPIQELTLNLALAGADIIGQARTGTGKTLGFGLPNLQQVDVNADHVQTLVIVPTRELCLQVAEDLEQAGKVKGVRVLATYGGKSLDPQIDALSKGGVHVVVGTPGRLLDLLRRGVLDLSTVRGLVLDEADEMLDLGFLPDVEQLIEATQAKRQTLLFSATMPSAVVALARRYMDRPTFLRADVEEVHIAPETEQHFFSCHRMDKPAVLARILQAPDRGLCVVFSRTKRMCDILAEELRERGIAAAPIHSDLRQESREKALSRFREGKIDVLVATEVAARGLDIDDVTHVVNYDCPDDEKMYLHRIGRTGRAGAAGVAITLAVWNELARLNMIKRALDIEDETHEVFSTSPILDELFDLPAREERPKSAARRAAAASEDAKDAKDAKDVKDSKDAKPARREPASKSRGGGARGRSRGERSKAPAGETTDTAQDASARPEDSGDERGAPRVRRRSRTRSARTEDAAPASTGIATDTSAAETSATEAPASEQAAPKGPQRTRTRTRSTPERPSGERAGTDGDTAAGGSSDAAASDASEASGAPPETAGPRRRTRTRRSSGSAGRSTGSGARDAAEAAAPAADRGAAGKAEGRERDGAREPATGGGRPRGDGNGSGGKGGRDRNSRGSSSSRSNGGRGKSRGRSGGGNGGGSKGRPAAAAAAAVSTDEARGDGQPRLRRPLQVAHLP